MSEPDERDVERLCVLFHDAYEAAAVGAGWETQERSRKPWADVPEANKETMRATVRAVLASDWLAERDAQQRAEALRRAAEAIETGPMVVNDLAREASRTAFLATWLRDRAERQRRPDYTRPHDSPGGQDEHPSTKPQHQAQPGDRPNPDPDGTPTDQRHRPR